MKREFTINSDLFSTFGMAFWLLVSLSLAVRDFRWLMHGHTTQTVTIGTVVLAVCALYFAAAFRTALPVGRIFRFAAALVGSGAAIRALTFYSHSSVEAQRLAGINGVVFSIGAYVLIFVGVLQWFRTVCRVQDQSTVEPR